MKEINYSVTLTIEKPTSLVSALFVDKTLMPVWEDGLTKIEDVIGTLFDEGSIGKLIFSFDHSAMTMGVHVHENNLPHRIVIEYTVPGAINHCVNTFIEFDCVTHWTMDVTFTFVDEVTLPRERFIQKTTKAMELFKAFVESR